jgi:hypothetical protein
MRSEEWLVDGETEQKTEEAGTKQTTKVPASESLERENKSN